MGLRALQSHTNFLLVEFGQDRVAAADAFFKARGLILRRVDSYKLPGFIRITVGDEDGCRRVADAAEAFMAQAGAA
jgi:histidinol-phosphate aminotransferase